MDSRSLPPSLPQRWSPDWPQQKKGWRGQPTSLDASLGLSPGCHREPQPGDIGWTWTGRQQQSLCHPQPARLGYTLGKKLGCQQDPAPLARPSTLITVGSHVPTPAAARQHPRGAPSTHEKLMLIHTGPLSVRPSCRGISPGLQIKAIAFSANIDSSWFSVNIYPQLNKKLLLQPRGRSRRPGNRHIRSWPAYQQRTRFWCS